MSFLSKLFFRRKKSIIYLLSEGFIRIEREVVAETEEGMRYRATFNWINAPQRERFNLTVKDGKLCYYDDSDSVVITNELIEKYREKENEFDN